MMFLYLADEWIRLEQQDDTVEVTHTTRVKNGLTSEIINGGLEFSPIPIPIDINNYNWQDHQVKGVIFQPDGCQIDTCQVTGINKLILPKETNIYSGLLTVEYQEKELLRSVRFRVPHDIEKETITFITIVTTSTDSLKK